jgi:autotransporter adhesin
VAQATDTLATSLSHGATAGNAATALGAGAEATFGSSIAVGSGAQTTRTGQAVIGSGASTYTLPGVGNLASQLAQTAGADLRVVTTDASGNLAGNVLLSSLGGAGGGPCSETANGLKCGSGATIDSSKTLQTALGVAARAEGTNATAVGDAARALADNATALGQDSLASGVSSLALGQGAQATAANSVALGAGAVATRANQVVIGGPGATVTLPSIVGNRASQSGPVAFVTTDAAGNMATTPFSVNQITDQISVLGAGLQNLSRFAQDSRKEARRGIAAAVAVAPALMPSGRGRTTVNVATSYYRQQMGFGVTVAHRLDVALPVVVQGSYSNGGGTEHVGRVAAGFEF